MNRNFDNEWERQLDGELKALPDVEAPPTLVPRVMQRVRGQVERRSSWSWQAWSPAWRAAFVSLLTVSLAAVVWVVWRLCEGRMTIAPFEAAQHWFAAVVALGRAAWVLVSALALGLQNIHPVFLALYGAFAVACYFACVGAGTVAYRYAITRRRNSDL